MQEVIGGVEHARLRTSGDVFERERQYTKRRGRNNDAVSGKRVIERI